MSAQGRGAERVANDVYNTPSWVVRRLLEAVPFPRGRWLEPCCGEGAIVREILPYCDDLAVADIRPEAIAAIVRMQSPKIGHYIAGDYTNRMPRPAGTYAVAISNPPYSYGEEIIARALEEAGYVAMLMRSSFGVRAPWMRDNMPDTYDLPDRPSFVATGVCAAGHRVTQPPTHSRYSYCAHAVSIRKLGDYCPSVRTCDEKMRWTTSDASEYSWLVWTPERGRRNGTRQILASTPLAERKLG